MYGFPNCVIWHGAYQTVPECTVNVCGVISCEVMLIWSHVSTPVSAVTVTLRFASTDADDPAAVRALVADVLYKDVQT